MIISDEHQFAFIHIPKCAGSTVRRLLQHYDSRDNYYWLTKKVDQNNILHFAHLTPEWMKAVCPDEFERIRGYRTFGLIREPKARFLSSFKQFISENGKRPLVESSPDEIRTELDGVIAALSRGVEMNPRYVHFTRQSDYVYYQEERFIDNIYRVENIDRFFADMEQQTGQSLNRDIPGHEKSRKNTSQVYRNDFMRRALGGIKPFAAKCLPVSIKNALRPVFFVPPSARKFDAFESDYARDFVRDYYRADMELYDDLRAGRVLSTPDKRSIVVT